MEFEKAWHKALKNTEIIRSRARILQTVSDTQVPYIFLAESSINHGDTVVRKGSVVVQKPSLIVPPNNPQFNGFEFDTEEGVDQNQLINFFIVRGVSFPSLRYNNQTNSLDVFEGRLSQAIEHYKNLLQQQEDVTAGLITGPEDVWQFSLLIFVASQIMKNADMDIRKLLDEHHRQS